MTVPPASQDDRLRKALRTPTGHGEDDEAKPKPERKAKPGAHPVAAQGNGASRAVATPHVIKDRQPLPEARPPPVPVVAPSKAGPRKAAPAGAGARVVAAGDARPEGAVVPPDLSSGMREVERTPIIPDKAWVRIVFNESERTYSYEVTEPTLSEDERTILKFLRDTLLRTLDGRYANRPEAEWSDILLEATRDAIHKHQVRLDDAGRERVEYHLIRDFLGYGPIDVLMRDAMIEDISCDGPGIPIYLFHRKYESLRTNVQFDDELQLDAFVIRLAQRSGKHISVADPLLDATLPDGSRLQATLSREVTTRGSSFTVRKFRADPLTPPDLIRLGTFDARMAAWFWFVMELGASFVLAGGTASGKTTSLNAISQFIPPEKKIVSIEDTREINLSHENWIAGITRTGFGGEIVGGKVAGTIDMYKLLEAALRQRPEYLLVGEVRGPEALTLFQAMATGHAVYSTMHADSVQSAVYRLENPPINVPRMMLQTLDIVAIQAQVRIGERMTRRIKEVTEIAGFDPDSRELLTNTVFVWDFATDQHRYLGKSTLLEQVMEARNIPEDQIMKEWSDRTEVLQWMVQQGMRHYADVARVVSAYYRDPKGIMAKIRAGASS
ncbi:MAG: archaeal flagellar protein FlaI [Thermoplasmata archaeon]|jgi:flagellar protein FlaI|nr:archaeal flagellar protein FlaI [Thermoplasmata archaeon]